MVMFKLLMKLLSKIDCESIHDVKRIKITFPSKVIFRPNEFVNPKRLVMAQVKNRCGKG